MRVFSDYAQYYDLLYLDRDYASEAAFVLELIQAHNPKAVSILDLGCGSGAHATHLAAEGYQVHGVDASAEMLDRAKTRQAEAHADQALRLAFSQGDIRAVRLDNRFDVVVSLFHVMSYQTSNADLRAAFATAKAHLNAGGIFIFDCWYGPAVLTEKPAARVKNVRNKTVVVTRVAEPILHADRNMVEIVYQLFIRKLSDDTWSMFEKFTKCDTFSCLRSNFGQPKLE